MAARTGEGARPHAPAFIRREIPPYELLGEEGLALVEAKADRILADVGMEIRDDPESLQLFKDAGASVDGITVHFDPGHVKALCATAPTAVHAAGSQPGEVGGDRRRQRRAGTDLRIAVRPRPGGWHGGTARSSTSRTSSS